MAAEFVPQISHKPDLQLQITTPDDIPGYTECWYTCFPEPFVRQMFPYTPSLVEWWNDTNRDHTANNAHAKLLIVKDISKEGGGKVVGHAKWWVPVGEKMFKVADRFPSWAEESDRALCGVFFGRIGKERGDLMRDRRYYHLDMLGTIPEYRRLSVATMLMDWGIEQADRDDLECFVDASDKGRPVYEKYGFLPEEPFDVPGMNFRCTSYIRPAKSSRVEHNGHV